MCLWGRRGIQYPSKCFRVVAYALSPARPAGACRLLVMCLARFPRQSASTSPPINLYISIDICLISHACPPPLIPPSTPHLSSNSLTHGTLCWPHQATLHLTHSTTRSPLPGHPRHVPPHLRRLPARPGGADAPHRALLNGHARARQVWGPFVFLLGPFISCLARSCPDVGLSVPVVVCCQTPRTSTAGGRVRVGLLLVR